MANLAQELCVPCQGDVPALTDDAISELHLQTPMWEVANVDGVKRLRRTFKFDHYLDGVEFASRVGKQADAQDHHPTIMIRYKQVAVEWYTHSINGLHRNDFVMAAKSDELFLACWTRRASRASSRRHPRNSSPPAIPPAGSAIRKQSRSSADPRARAELSSAPTFIVPRSGIATALLLPLALRRGDGNRVAWGEVSLHSPAACAGSRSACAVDRRSAPDTRRARDARSRWSGSTGGCSVVSKLKMSASLIVALVSAAALPPSPCVP